MYQEHGVDWACGGSEVGRPPAQGAEHRTGEGLMVERLVEAAQAVNTPGLSARFVPRGGAEYLAVDVRGGIPDSPCLVR